MCFEPVYVFNKNSQFWHKKYAHAVRVPCGRCPDCRVSHAKEGALRCMLHLKTESNQKNAWFITLTYNEDKNTYVLVRRDIQLFFKRLRDKFKNCQIRYLYAGEYGELNYRPHFHLVVFGLPISDLYYLSLNFANDIIGSSKTIEKIGGNGYVAIGNLTYNSAAYTCRYSLKKVSNCSTLFACSHGFGLEGFNQNGKKIYSLGYIIFNGRKFAIPRYFLKKLRAKIGEKKYREFIFERIKANEEYKSEIAKKFPEMGNSVSNKYAQVVLLDKPTYAEKMTLQARKVIKQSLYEFYKKRSNFINFIK